MAVRHGVVSVAFVGRTMIVRQFIGWIRTAPAGERAEATRSLARAWLISDLSDDDRAAAEGAFLRLLDDPSPLVRQAMAEVFASSAHAPAVIVQALSVDQPSVARPVLEYSPLLIDTDLVDILATGNSEAQCAIARRTRLPASVCAALAEVGTGPAALELIANASAKLEPISYNRIVERHGHVPAIREKMLMLEDLPSAIRLALVAKLSETLTQFVVGRNWLSADRAGRVARETRARSTVNIAAQSRGDDMRGLVRHLRATGQLTAGLILRALLSANLELFDCALVELSGLPQARVSALLHDRGGASLNALLTPAGLPPSTFPALAAALVAGPQVGVVGTFAEASQIPRTFVERGLNPRQTHAETAGPLLTLLRRFAAESAREEARALGDEPLPVEAAAVNGQDALIAA